jgi:hypothetical protein
MRRAPVALCALAALGAGAFVAGHTMRATASPQGATPLAHATPVTLSPAVRGLGDAAPLPALARPTSTPARTPGATASSTPRPSMPATPRPSPSTTSGNVQPRPTPTAQPRKKTFDESAG